MTQTYLESPSETRPTADDPLLHANHDILVLDLAVPFGGIIIPKDLERSDNVNSLRARLDKDERVTLVWRRVGRVGHCQNNMDSVARVTSAGDPPLVAVDDDLVAFYAGGRVLEVGGVGRSD